MLVRKYKQHLFDATVDLLWRQWTALGVSGQIAVPKSEWILDPEALIVFSAGFARYDQRLYDLTLDWMQVHSSLINVQRLKGLHAKAQWKDSASLHYMASVLAEKIPDRWRKPSSDYAVERPEEIVSLFKNPDNEPEEFIPHRDPLAFRCGFFRNVRISSGKVSAALPQSVATLLLRMRGLLGISARVETILILLSHAPCKVQEIVNCSGFKWKSIQDVLGELMSANLVTQINGNARGKSYLLNTPEKLLSFLEIHTPNFIVWTDVFDAIGLLWTMCSNPAFAEVSGETFQGELENLFREKIQQCLLRSNMPVLKGVTNLIDFPKLIRQI